jgi:hypothetical protein
MCITDDYFKCLSKIGRISKLTHLTCRHLEEITEKTPIAFFKHCPDLQVHRLSSFSRFHVLTYDLQQCIDLFNCSLVENEVLFKALVELSHAKGCKPRRYSIVVSFTVSASRIFQSLCRLYIRIYRAIIRNVNAWKSNSTEATSIRWTMKNISMNFLTTSTMTMTTTTMMIFSKVTYDIRSMCTIDVLHF